MGRSYEYYLENKSRIDAERIALKSINIIAFDVYVKHFHNIETDVFYNRIDMEYRFEDGYKINDEFDRWYALIIPEYRIKVFIEKGTIYDKLNEYVDNKIDEYNDYDDYEARETDLETGEITIIRNNKREPWDEDVQEPDYLQNEDFEERIMELRKRRELNDKRRNQKKARDVKKGLDKFNAENYKIFCKEEREKIKIDNPNLTIQEISKELGRRWRNYKIINK